MSEPKSKVKSAIDAYGGDPLNPNDAMLERIAAVAKGGGKKDDTVDRWAEAVLAVCPEPATPKRTFLCKIAESIDSGKKNDEVSAWASGESAKRVPKSEHNLDHLE